jgi:trehalose-6-phosphate synthase
MQAMRHALAMPRVERHIRWRKLINRFEEESLTEFCDRFINALKISTVGPCQNAG